MPRILIYATLSWPSAARYAGGFVTAGCEVFALAPAYAPVHASRYVADSAPYNPLAPLKSLRSAIATWSPDLILPCDDRAVATLLRLHAAEPTQSSTAGLVARSLGNPANYARVISRSTSLGELAALGVRVPDTLGVDDERTLEGCLDVTGFPAVLKSDGSWGGEGVVIVRTLKQARAAYRKLAVPSSRLRSLVRTVRRRDLHFLAEALSPPKRAVCVQRYVEGMPCASAFAAFGGKVVAELHYDALEAHNTIGPPSVIRRVDCREMEAATHIVARQFGLSGLHGIDFIRDASGQVHLIEINPRATQGGTLPFGTGRDLPSALVSALANTPAKMREPIRKRVVVFFPREWQRDPASPYLKSGHHDVPWDDPAILNAALGVRTNPKRRAAAL